MGGGLRRYAAGVLSVDHWPEISEPLMVVALSGWVDAGGAGAGAMAALVEQLDDRDAFGSIDVGDARRPAADAPDRALGRSARVIDWPRITFECGRAGGGRERAGRDVVVVRGPEPSLRWPTVASTIVDAAPPPRRAPGRDARRHPGARLAPPRGGRARRRRRSARSRRRSSPLRADYAGPTGLQTVVLRALGDAGHPGRRPLGAGSAVRGGLAVAARDRARCSPGSSRSTTSISTCGRSTSAARRTCAASRPASTPGPT